MDSADVVVVGAGPTGLMLACELALGGIGVRLLEERIDKPNITRAFAVHARTLELLADPAELDRILGAAADRANEVANRSVRRGFRYANIRVRTIRIL